MRFPVLPVAMAAVVLTVMFGGYAWALTASWVLVGIVAWLADRRWAEAERLIAEQPPHTQGPVRDRARPVEPTVRALPAPDPASRLDTLH